MKKLLLLSLVIGTLGVLREAGAETPEYALVLENHRFVPAELTVPAGKRLKLVIENRDATPEEFDSYDLRREKVIAGSSKGEVWVGPLDPGSYSFMGEYHAETAKGRLIAK
ncbi:MAG TPA: cupredoxin domain-containing protein [Burkholderiales bacterium]|nr:cupredoxin domain-containing protein [Burkholderiales bacterium]